MNPQDHPAWLLFLCFVVEELGCDMLEDQLTHWDTWLNGFNCGQELSRS